MLLILSVILYLMMN